MSFDSENTAVTEVRLARPEDAEVIAGHRARMFHEMGVLPDELVDALDAATRERLPELIGAGVYVGWLAEEVSSRRVVAGVGLLLRTVLPRPVAIRPGVTALADREKIILNAFTEPSHRRKGLARALMTQAVAWSQGNDLARLVLHASDQGRPLYEQLGFRPSNEMRYVEREASRTA